MKKNNYNLDYYSQYDYIQKNSELSCYETGKINKIEVTLYENSSFVSDVVEDKKFSKTQMSSFLLALCLNGYFPKMRESTTDANFCLNYNYTNQKEILSFLKYIYFEGVSQDLKKNTIFSSDKNYSYIKVKVPLVDLFKVQDLSNYFSADLTNTYVYFQFKLNHSVKNKNKLINVFPFWIND